MSLNDKRSYNNGELSSVNVAAFKKKSKRLGQVQFKVGSKKFDLPVEAFLLTTESGHGFLSVQPVNAVVSMKTDNLFEAVHPKELDNAVSAIKAYRDSKGKSAKASAKVEIPDEVQKLLATSVPKGYKLVFDGSGYKLAKMRTRAKK